MGHDVHLGMGGSQGAEETGVRWSILQGEGEEARSLDSVLAWNGGAEQQSLRVPLVEQPSFRTYTMKHAHGSRGKP